MGVTTVLGIAFPKPALVGWSAKEVAEAVVNRRECLADFTDDELRDFLRGAPSRVRNPAANRGTEVHRLANRLAHGEDVDVPVELLDYVDAYLAFLRAFEPSEALIERPCFNRRLRYGGTFDMVARLGGPGAGRRYLVDIKTSGSGVYGEVALQLAAYGHAEFYLDELGAEQPMPALDAYGALWVRPDGYDFYPVEVTSREWAAFRTFHRGAKWIKERQERVLSDPLWQLQAIAV
jgi:hypothetical protein